MVVLTFAVNPFFFLVTRVGSRGIILWFGPQGTLPIRLMSNTNQIKASSLVLISNNHLHREKTILTKTNQRASKCVIFENYAIYFA